MEPIYIVLLVIVGLAIFLGIIQSANSVLWDKVEKYSNTTPISKATTIGLIYFIRKIFDLDIDIKRIKGKLTDCYIPKYKTIALSDDSFNKSSLSAIAITSHELGHAIQHKNNSTTFNFVRLVRGIASFFGSLVLPAIITGVIMLFLKINISVAYIIIFIALGIVLSSFLAKLFTIPLEHSASKIAINFLKDNAILNDEELKIVKKITDAALFTYVADFIKDILGLNLLKRRN